MSPVAESTGGPTGGPTGAGPDGDAGRSAASTPQRTRGRRLFAPVVLAGLASAGLAAVAGARPWVQPEGGSGSDAAIGYAVTGTDPGESPVVTSLALVLLACWGVVLVARGRARRVVAVLGALASLGALVAAVSAWLTLDDAVADALGPAGGGTEHTWWSYVGVLACLAAAGVALPAVRLVREWPEMGTRYDTPQGGAAPTRVSTEDASNLDLWKAIDEGRDPTA